MLTFDSQLPTDPLQDLITSTLPDAIMIGENNEAWLYVRRSTEKIEIVSKQTGRITSHDITFAAARSKYGLSDGQIDAARRALAL